MFNEESNLNNNHGRQLSSDCPHMLGLISWCAADLQPVLVLKQSIPQIHILIQNHNPMHKPETQKHYIIFNTKATDYLEIVIYILIQNNFVTWPFAVRANEHWLWQATFLTYIPARPSITFGLNTRFWSPWPSLPEEIQSLLQQENIMLSYGMITKLKSIVLRNCITLTCRENPIIVYKFHRFLVS